MVFICPYSQSREDWWDRLPGLGFDPENKAVTGMGRLRFELRTNRLKAECSTAELATQCHWMQPSKSSLDQIEEARGLERKVSPGGSPPLQADHPSEDTTFALAAAG